MYQIYFGDIQRLKKKVLKTSLLTCTHCLASTLWHGGLVVITEFALNSPLQRVYGSHLASVRLFKYFVFVSRFRLGHRWYDD